MSRWYLSRHRVNLRHPVESWQSWRYWRSRRWTRAQIDALRAHLATRNTPPS